MEERKCIAYNKAAQKLGDIGSHAQKVAEAYPGYYLDIKNIFGYTNMNPFSWYGGTDAHFRDVSKKDRVRVYIALNAFKKQDVLEREIIDACKACADLSKLLSQKTVLVDEGLGALAD